MKEIKNKAPESCDRNKGIDNNISVTKIDKTIEIPDTLPGCYQEYKGEGDCIGCLYRLPCARMSAGGDNE